MVNAPVRMANALLVVSLLLLVTWALGIIGVGNMHVSWFMLVVAWGLFMAWCYAFYVADRHNRRHHVV